MDQTTITTMIAAVGIASFLVGAQAHRIASKRYQRQRDPDTVARITTPNVKLRIVHRGEK